jgi:predicted DNA-binding transcriptional regulator AlpA
MGRKVNSDDLVGAHEIAQRLGMGRPQVVHEWRRRHKDFPKPIATLKTAMIWDWQDVKRWARKTGRATLD